MKMFQAFCIRGSDVVIREVKPGKRKADPATLGEEIALPIGDGVVSEALIDQIVAESYPGAVRYVPTVLSEETVETPPGVPNQIVTVMSDGSSSTIDATVANLTQRR